MYLPLAPVEDCLREKSHRNVLVIVFTSPSLVVAAAVIIDIVMARTQMVNRYYEPLIGRG